MRLTISLRRFWPSGRTAVAVDLTPAQQIVLLTLRARGPLPFAVLIAAVESRRFYAPPADLVSGMLTLDGAGLIEQMAESSVPPTARRYRLTGRGRRALRAVPPEPRSVLAVRV